VLVSDFNYHLPAELIAQEPLADRAGSRMLHFAREAGVSPQGDGPRLDDRRFQDFPGMLRSSDLLVLNNTRVFPARLYGRRSGVKAQPVSPKNRAARGFLQGRVEVLLTRRMGENEWQALVRPGRKIGVGEWLAFPDADGIDRLRTEVIARGEFGERTLRFEPLSSDDDFFEVLDQIGHVPLPPYIDRPDTGADRQRYQTVFADKAHIGSVAAPTAGLHFTPKILDRIRERGIETAEVTLHVGLGTFQPLHHDKVEDNKLHRESFSISAQAAEQINRARASGRRIVAVGTTTVRVLEHAARDDQAGTCEIRPGSSNTDIFIYPGFEFRAVNAMLTNFHLPHSSLLMLVCAFAGKERVLRAYEHAVGEKYRFFSYGDCMFVE
jgi:S-adenosylmethionine:tRNA ribosyltransferase-isomerase